MTEQYGGLVLYIEGLGLLGLRSYFSGLGSRNALLHPLLFQHAVTQPHIIQDPKLQITGRLPYHPRPFRSRART